ncbi:MAG TPA: rod shape-determining protein MreD [Gammaproteobacteria bacterium]|nr:rod shape-determining protein MreD [Gammaproteobacteria bacterium]
MNGRRLWVIWLTFAVALLLTILPLPEWARPFRPQWATLALIYWCLALPHRISVGTGFVLGLLLDVLTGTLLGQHALGLSLVAYIAVQLHARIRVFPLWQQAFAVLVLLTLEQILSLWAMAASGQATPGLRYWAIPVTGAALWPWTFMLLRNVRRRFKVA